MADPLSTTASIAGIVSLAGSVFHIVSKYVREAKGEKAKVVALATETRNLSGILHNLSLLASSMDDQGTKTAFRAYQLHACRQTLLKINDVLSKAEKDFLSGNTLTCVSRSLK